MRFRCNIIVDLYTVEAFSDDLARVGDQDKCFRVIRLDEISEPHCLDTVQGSKNDIFVSAGVSTLCLAYAGAPPERVHDEIADLFRVVTYDIEVF